VAAFLSLWIFGGSPVQNNPYVFSPGSLSSMYFILTLYLITKNFREWSIHFNKKNLIITALVCLVFPALIFIQRLVIGSDSVIATLFVPLLPFAFIIFNRDKLIYGGKFQFATILLTAFTFHVNFTLSKYLFGNIYQGVSGSDVSFGDKVYYLQEGTTDALTIALIAGGILMVWQSFRNEKMYLAIVALLALSFLIYFLPEGFFLRSRFLIPFGALVIAGGANAIIVLCENRFKRIAKFHGKISFVRLFSIII